MFQSDPKKIFKAALKISKPHTFQKAQAGIANAWSEVVDIFYAKPGREQFKVKDYDAMLVSSCLLCLC